MKRKNTLIESQDQEIEPTEDGEREESPDTTSKNQSSLDRRRFLTRGMGAAAGVFAIANTSLVSAQRRRNRPGAGQGPGAGMGKAQTAGNSSTSPPFREPEVVEARHIGGESVLNFTLNAEMTQWRSMCGGQNYYDVPIFNQGVPGATFLVDPGTTMNLVLNNRLPVKSPFTGDQCGTHSHSEAPPKSALPKPECFMHTNLHTHGLFVSPCSLDMNDNISCGPYAIDGIRPPLKSSSDDVLIDIYPQQKANYCIVLPDFHAPGTYWYHSHLHGASGYQVASGMAGVIIIREPPGQELVQPDRDKIWFMQEVSYGEIKNDVGQTFPSVYGNLATESTGMPDSTFYINGLCKPTLQMFTGQTQRWRFINGTGTPRGLMKLRLIKMSENPKAVINDADVVKIVQGQQGPTLVTPPASRNTVMNLIAVDGLSFYGFAPQPVKQHLIAAGNRADFLINIPLNQTPGQGSGPGKYVLLKDAFPKDATSINSTDYVGASLKSAQVLAYIEVYPSTYYNEPIPTKIPGERPRYLQAIGKVDKVREGPTPGSPTLDFQSPGKAQFQINGKFYDPNVIDVAAPLNTAEEWTIGNKEGANTHPFHIHVNPFQMVGRTIDFEVEKPQSEKMDPNDPCNWMWMDTVALPISPNPIKIRTRFLVYQGEYVLHCHILVHEDVGMMMNVKICAEDDKKCAESDRGKGKGVEPCKKLKDYPDPARNCIDRTKKTC
jgi:FtsP/CotA-like multicopper oxidase with cupredoxin domain